jgi:hypothetical protein
VGRESERDPVLFSQSRLFIANQASQPPVERLSFVVIDKIFIMKPLGKQPGGT